jgi:hypothetical protein
MDQTDIYLEVSCVEVMERSVLTSGAIQITTSEAQTGEMCTSLAESISECKESRNLQWEIYAKVLDLNFS